MVGKDPFAVYLYSMAKTKTPTKTTKVTKAAVLAHLATARKVNLSQQHKGHYTDKSAQRLATAIEKAHSFPSLTTAKIHKGGEVSRLPEDADIRRQYAKSHRAPLVSVTDIVRGKIRGDRPENAVRARLRSIAKAMGLPEDTYYAVRAKAYAKGETPKVYIVRL
jgi:hypothetical protein